MTSHKRVSKQQQRQTIGSEETDASASLLQQDGGSTVAKTSEDNREQSDTVPPWAQRMIQELGSVQQKIQEHLPTIQATTTRIESELTSLATRVNQAEQRISDMEDTLSPLSAGYKALESSTSVLAQRVEYLENYSRRNNLRLVNIPEGMEGTNIKSFATDLLKDILRIPDDQTAPEVERVHRLGPQRGQNEKPRTILLRLQRFEDREKILRASRMNKELSFKSQKFLIFQDFSAEVSRRRMEYKPIKAALHERNIPFKLLFPARLVVKIGTQTHSFDTPSKAKAELSRLKPTIRF